MKKCGAQLLKGKLPVSDLKCFHLLSSNDVITHSLTPLPSLLSLSNHVALAATLKEKKTNHTTSCDLSAVPLPGPFRTSQRTNHLSVFSQGHESIFFFFQTEQRPRRQWLGHKVGEEEKKQNKKQKKRNVLKSRVWIRHAVAGGENPRLLVEAEWWKAANQLLLTFPSQAVVEKNKKQNRCDGGDGSGTSRRSHVCSRAKATVHRGER